MVKIDTELNQAIPPTQTLNSEAQKSRAELARQGSLAERNLPRQLSARQKYTNPDTAGSPNQNDESSSINEDESDQDSVMTTFRVVGLVTLSLSSSCFSFQ